MKASNTPVLYAEFMRGLLPDNCVGAEIGVGCGRNCENLLSQPNLIRRLFAFDP